MKRVFDEEGWCEGRVRVRADVGRGAFCVRSQWAWLVATRRVGCIRNQHDIFETKTRVNDGWYLLQ
jgi:hypothetical protein